MVMTRVSVLHLEESDIRLQRRPRTNTASAVAKLEPPSRRYGTASLKLVGTCSDRVVRSYNLIGWSLARIVNGLPTFSAVAESTLIARTLLTVANYSAS
jgi:hypothetical protein